MACSIVPPLELLALFRHSLQANSLKQIATDVDDSPAKMRDQVRAQQQKPGLGIDPYFYRSHVTYETELSQILFKTWLYAGHASEIPEPGDYLLFEPGEESIIVCRNKAGEINAFVNVCRHRGSRLCEEPCGRRNTFVCPYHGWAYGTDGRLINARDMSSLPNFDPADYSLLSVRLVAVEGLIFINCDPQAADFQTPLASVAERLADYDLAGARIAHHHNYRVDANWKFCVENFMECYHCGPSHRSYAKMHSLAELNERVEPLNQQMLERSAEMTGVEGLSQSISKAYLEAEAFGTCVYYGRYALYPGYSTGSREGKPVAPLMGRFRGYDGGVSDFSVGAADFYAELP